MVRFHSLWQVVLIKLAPDVFGLYHSSWQLGALDDRSQLDTVIAGFPRATQLYLQSIHEHVTSAVKRGRYIVAQCFHKFRRHSVLLVTLRREW